jgi:predicted negative regulator of RcsB-dependent stress response
LAHISRKELKKDELRDSFVHGAEAVYSHQRLAASVIGAVLIVLVAILGWRFYAERQTGKASAALDDAMQVYNARIRTAVEPADPGEITYTAEKNKFEDAAKKLLAVASKYSRTRPGQMARYYAALSYEQLGRNEEAQKSLQEVANSGDNEIAAVARFALAKLYDRTGKGDDAVKLYQQLIAKPAVLAPKPVVMLALAGHYAKTNPSEAAKLYNQVKLDYPDSAVSRQADEQLELLPGKS